MNFCIDLYSTYHASTERFDHLTPVQGPIILTSGEIIKEPWPSLFWLGLFGFEQLVPEQPASSKEVDMALRSAADRILEIREKLGEKYQDLFTFEVLNPTTSKYIPSFNPLNNLELFRQCYAEHPKWFDLKGNHHASLKDILASFAVLNDLNNVLRFREEATPEQLSFFIKRAHRWIDLHYEWSRYSLSTHKT